MVKIYGLVCPFTGEIRYIGKTERKLQKRLSGHLGEMQWLKRTSHKRRWLAKCQSVGMVPTIWLLEEVASTDSWQERERAWIKKAREIGLDLTNQTAGGEGMNFIDPEAEVRYRKKQSAASRKTYHENHEMRKAFLDGGKRSWGRDRNSRAAAINDAKKTHEYKLKHAKAMEEVRNRPGFKEGRSEHGKRVWETSRDKLMTAFAKPEVKAKHSARAKRCWSDPETRERMMNRWTPEARAKQAAALAARSEKIQAAMTPEVRAKQAAKLKETWAKRKAAASG